MFVLISPNQGRSEPGVAAKTMFLSMGIRAAVLSTALAAVVAQAAAQSDKPLTYVDILQQLTDLDRLTRLQPGCKGGLFSSWDRNSTRVWGANGDARPDL